MAAVASGNKVKAYMKEWMNLTAISSFMKTDTHLYCTAKDRGVLKTYRCVLTPDIFGQCQIDMLDNGAQEWDLAIDCVTIDEKMFKAQMKSQEAALKRRAKKFEKGGKLK